MVLFFVLFIIWTSDTDLVDTYLIFDIWKFLKKKKLTSLKQVSGDFKTQLSIYEEALLQK